MQEGGTGGELNLANTRPGTKPFKTPVLLESEVIIRQDYWTFVIFVIECF